MMVAWGLACSLGRDHRPHPENHRRFSIGVPEASGRIRTRHEAICGARRSDNTEAVKASPARKEKDDLLQGIPGLGPVSSLTLLAALPELGTLDGGKISSLVGLAPFADDSGTRRGGRHVRGGRAAVRRILYLAALSAIRRNPAMEAFRERLLARGKRPKVILTAVARKLLVIANAVIRAGQPRDSQLALTR